MEDNMKSSIGNLHWDVIFIRAMNNWELESLVSFLDTLYSTKWGRVEGIHCVSTIQNTVCLS